jgi:hypothetical protein
MYSIQIRLGSREVGCELVAPFVICTVFINNNILPQ